MTRTARSLEPAFVAGGVIAAALCIAALLWAGLGQTPAMAALAGIVAALVSAVALTLATRVSGSLPRPEMESAGATGDLARRLNALSRRLETLEARMNTLDQSIIERTRATVVAVSAELDAVGSVVRDLAEAVAIHDSELFAEVRSYPNPELDPKSSIGANKAAVIAAEPGRAEGAGGEPFAEAIAPDITPPSSTKPDIGEPERLGRVSSNEIRALLPRAIAEDRLDLHLQSIVTLPQRKVKLYEAMHYLRGDRNRSFAPADLRKEAEIAFAEGPLDQYLVQRAERVIRHLKERNREIALLCRVSSRSFFMPEFFNEIARIAKTDRDGASHLVFTLDQAGVRSMGPLELENLEALQRMGYRMGLDGVTDLRVDPRQLAERGFRYLKVPADLLLMEEGSAAQSEIHPADLSGLLARHGITLIAEGIGSEKTVLDLLDFNVPLAQGSVFASPRAVRIDLIDTERTDKPAPAPAPVPVLSREEPSSFRAALRRAGA